MVFYVSIGVKREKSIFKKMILPTCPYKACHVIFNTKIAKSSC